MEGSPHLISWFYGFEGGTKAHPRSIKRATYLLLWQKPNRLGHCGCIGEKACHLSRDRI